jgi:hypothetical protein
VKVGGKTVDVYDQVFGFRTMECTPRDGFKLNGRRVELYGTCNHHDLGALGAAFNTRAMERQLEILKEMGALEVEAKVLEEEGIEPYLAMPVDPCFTCHIETKFCEPCHDKLKVSTTE